MAVVSPAPEHWKGGIILAALPAEGACMTVDQLAEATGLENVQITRLVTTLDRQGLIRKARRGCYRRSPAGDQALAEGRTKSGPKASNGVPRRRGGFTDQIWKALRMLRKATLPELLEIAGDGGIRQSHSVASRYLTRLTRAGVTVKSARRVPGVADSSPGFAQHILIHDFGPKAPVWSPKLSCLVDDNSGRLVADVIGGAS